MTRGIDKVFCSLIYVNSSITTKENLSGIYEASKDVATHKGDSGQNFHHFSEMFGWSEDVQIIFSGIFPVYFQKNGIYFLAHLDMNEDS